MKHWKFVTAFALSLTLSSFAQIIESKRMAEIVKNITPATLVVFDLDNTIMEAAQLIGSDQWFEHRIDQLKGQGLSADDAVNQTVVEWQAINFVGNVRLVEKGTARLIQQLQNQGVATMGLTARPATFADQSLRQLKRLGVDLSRNTVSDSPHSLYETDRATFRDGLMSVGKNNKGTILLALLKQVGFTPERVVFVDDKVKNVTHVDAALTAAAVPVFAYRYGAADARVKSFDFAAADAQLEHFFNFGEIAE